MRLRRMSVLWIMVMVWGHLRICWESMAKLLRETGPIARQLNMWHRTTMVLRVVIVLGYRAHHVATVLVE